MAYNRDHRTTNIKNLLTIQVPFAVSVLSIMTLLLDIGFEHATDVTTIFRYINLGALIIGGGWILRQLLHPDSRPRLIVKIVDIAVIACILIIIVIQLGLEVFDFFPLFKQPYSIYILLIIVFVREFSALKINIQYKVFNPAQILAVSFIVVIILGALLLMLPQATHQDITLVDALFTATSAVCVTGLTSVDTGTCFTSFGHTLIMILIQIGGLGIMTFASYFSYFFRNDSTYKNQLLISEMTNADKLGEVFSVVKRIIFITLIIESIGALLIYNSLDCSTTNSLYDRIFFSLFHAISAFCNAGFSTLSNNLYDEAYRFNYPLHLYIAFLIIFGGIGFPITYNIYLYIKTNLLSLGAWLLFKKRLIHTPWLININTRIVLTTTLILITGGTGLFFLFEYNNTLSEHSLFGKIVASFFGAVTPRTAGFNSVNTAALATPTTLIVIFLMWVGASPVSTGGGIKTSSLAIAFLNMISIAKGKTRLNIFYRVIPQVSVSRAFAIILLSIIVIMVSVLCMVIIEKDKNLLSITFECVSAYGTVGLSRGITTELSAMSKIVLIFTMFAGRVGMLTLLMSLLKRVTSETTRYPTENILIN